MCVKVTHHLFFSWCPIETSGGYEQVSVYLFKVIYYLINLYCAFFSLYFFTLRSPTLLPDLLPFPDLDKFLHQIPLGAWTVLYTVLLEIYSRVFT